MPSSAKTELRRCLRAELARMSPAAHAAASESIRTSIPTLPRWQAVRIVAAYAALPDEPDLQPFDWAPERILLLPRMDGETIAFHEIRTPSDLVPGRFGVLEPDPAKCPPAAASTANMIFVPGAAFTGDGDRLGRGRGCYDRLLATLPPTVLRVGVCFRAQLVESLPLEAHDQGVDIVLTSSS